ncbi:hypothetical protein JD82_02216 [Prauserella rugosa]|uniref:Uncharacterized protein n=1 Tax=Prauserella rugosa TaxID=43354 RepID=A0A660C9S9_9PSEU|nr:hypothetical protein JD82_02216 [Prauserella rugosa]
MSDGMLLARPLPGVVGLRQRVSHVFRLPDTTVPPERVTALCGASFAPAQLQRVDNPTGMPCELCLARTPRQTGPLVADQRRARGSDGLA